MLPYLAPIELIRLCGKLEKEGLSRKEQAAHVHKSEAWVSQSHALLHGPKNMLKAIEKGTLSRSNALHKMYPEAAARRPPPVKTATAISRLLMWGGFNKGQAREAVMHHYDGYAQTALFFPGIDNACLILALKIGIIDRHTFIIACENDHSTAKVIRRFLRANFDHFYLHEGDVHTLSLDEVLEGRKIDFAFIDPCGQMTANIANWLSILSHHCNVGAKFAFTFSSAIRYQLFMNYVADNESKLFKAANIGHYVKIWQPMLKADNTPKHQGTKPTLIALVIALRGKFAIDLGREYIDKKIPMTFFLTTKTSNKSRIDPEDFFSNPSEDKMKTSTTSTVQDIIQRFKDAKKNVHAIAGARRMATCYVQRQTAQGKDENRTKGALRAQLTRAGLPDAY